MTGLLGTGDSGLARGPEALRSSPASWPRCRLPWGAPGWSSTKFALPFADSNASSFPGQRGDPSAGRASQRPFPGADSTLVIRPHMCAGLRGSPTCSWVSLARAVQVRAYDSISILQIEKMSLRKRKISRIICKKGAGHLTF